MTRDDAIRWIQNRMQHGRYTPSVNNPYQKDDCHIAGQMAIEALEKQIPKKPHIRESKVTQTMGWYCGACEVGHVPYKGSYCCRCGQAIDWSDEE